MISTSQLTSLAITQFTQLTLLIVLVGLIHRLLANRLPRLMTLLWAIVLIKSLLPPIWSSPLGLFSWAQASTIAGADRYLAAAGKTGWGGDYWLFEGASATLLMAWAMGSLFMILRFSLQAKRLESQLQQDRLVAEDSLCQEIYLLADQHDLRHPDRVVVSRDELGPAVSGVLRQTIVLPASLVAERNAQDPLLRAVLLHELVHLKRRDAAVSLLLTAAKILWWFHPLVWWAGRRADALVERCVDLTVTRELNTSLVDYGRGLLRVLELRATPVPGAELASLRPCQITKSRLEYLRHDHSESRTDWRGSMARLLLLASLAVVLLPSLPVNALHPDCLIDTGPRCTHSTGGAAQEAE